MEPGGNEAQSETGGTHSDAIMACHDASRGCVCVCTGILLYMYVSRLCVR